MLEKNVSENPVAEDGVSPVENTQGELQACQHKAALAVWLL